MTRMQAQYIFLSNTTPCEETIFCVLGTQTRYPFWCCEIPTEISGKLFCCWWYIFNAFVLTCAFSLHTTHVQNKTCRFDTEGFVPVYSLCGIVGPPSWFEKSLIGKTGNIWPVLYINAKFIYSSSTRACTIIEYEIVCNVHHFTSIWPIISWWCGATNDSHNPRTERPFWNSWEVKCMPASVWIISISHQPNSSTFPNLARKISSLSMTSSVVIFSIQ